MKKLLLLSSLVYLFNVLNAQPLKRADSFFGIHFDFHATQYDKEIGKTFTPAMIDSFLTIVKPDFVQVDCKGHPGYSSYPTKVGNQAGGYTKDILKIWREETAKHNVALYVHYSGLMDAKAVKDHPEWARILPDSTPDKEKVAYMGDYSDKLLISQLKEISDYRVNGAWIDGECWATQPDYSPNLLELFKNETGIANVPKSASDPHYKEFIEFNRKMFRQYLNKYIDAIHAYNHAFQITSNWSFSSMMPEPVDVKVDYLSGDVAGQNCVYNAGFQARCMALQGKPWDLMAWGFTLDFGPAGGFGGPKSIVQLEKEAAEVMAMGGGFQAYFTQNRDGSIKPWYFNEMGELGDFCRQRQPFCKGAETIPQIGLWYSTYSKRKQTDQVYGWNVPNVEGNLSLLLDGQNSVEILMDHQLKKKLDQYPVIIIPEWTGLDSNLKQKVLDYVQSGGNLLVIGASAVKEFEPQLGVTFKGTPETKVCTLGFDKQISSVKTVVQYVNPDAGTQVMGELYSSDDFRFPMGNPVATIALYGKGKIAGCYLDLANAYYTYQARGYLRIVNAVIDNLFPNPIVRVTGSDYVHTTVSKKDGKWFVHLINTAGNHFNQKVYEYDHIPSTGELTVELKTVQPIKKIVLQPEGMTLNYKKGEGMVYVTIPSVSVHSIIQLEF
ncbi:MAG TPA: hypothetical protein VIK20_08150 [Bacteroidales bacterium]